VRVTEERARAVAERAQCEEILAAAADELAERAALEEETRRAVRRRAAARGAGGAFGARAARAGAPPRDRPRGDEPRGSRRSLHRRRPRSTPSSRALADRLEGVRRGGRGVADGGSRARAEQVAQAQFAHDEAGRALRAGTRRRGAARAALARADEARTSKQAR
jgi:hypothetical protein